MAENSSHISKNNWLRAGVLGAEDGIVSVAGLVLGVAGATNSISTILTAGVAGLVAGAISMAAGEYVSVSSSRDSEKSILDQERRELKNNPEQELTELAQIYQRKGLSAKTAKQVAQELTDHDAIAAHFDAELGLDPNHLTNPWHAAGASAIAFFCGAILPIIAIIFPPESTRVPFTFCAVLVALALTGYISARVANANIWRNILRVVAGGVVAMVVTYSIGRAFGVAGL